MNYRLLLILSSAFIGSAMCRELIEVRLDSAAGGYAAGDYVMFESVNDFANNINGTFVANVGAGGDGVLRDSLGASMGLAGQLTGQYWAYDNNTQQLLNGGLGTVGAAAWLTGTTVSDFSVNQRSSHIEVALATAAGGHSAGVFIAYSSAANFLSNTGGIETIAAPSDILYDSYSASLSPTTETATWSYSNSTQQVTGAIGQFNGTASWLAGATVGEFSVNQLVTTPEPAGAVLCLLGMLAVFGGRRRARSTGI